MHEDAGSAGSFPAVTMARHCQRGGVQCAPLKALGPQLQPGGTIRYVSRITPGGHKKQGICTRPDLAQKSILGGLIEKCSRGSAAAYAIVSFLRGISTWTSINSSWPVGDNFRAAPATSGHPVRTVKNVVAVIRERRAGCTASRCYVWQEKANRHAQLHRGQDRMMGAAINGRFARFRATGARVDEKYAFHEVVCECAAATGRGACWRPGM